MTSRPTYCCGKCPELARGGYDCTCRGNPRCEESGVLLVVEFRLKTSSVITANQRMHWSKKAKLTKQIRTITKLEGKRLMARENVQPFTEKVRVLVHLSFSDSRRRDPANWSPTTKAALDGLVDSGLLVDDSAEYIDGPDHRLGPLGERGYVGVRFEFLEVE